MKRIGKGDYAWSVSHADLPRMAQNMSQQVKGHLEKDEGPLMSVGLAKLSARCGLDYLYSDERARIRMPTDYHLDDNAKPRCGRKDESAKYRTSNPTDPRLSCPECLDLAKLDRDRIGSD